MKTHQFMVMTAKLGKKGQITIPKKIRDEDSLKEDDAFKVTHMPGGDIILTKKATEKTPDEQFFEFLEGLPPFDAKKAWKEVEAERDREHR